MTVSTKRKDEMERFASDIFNVANRGSIEAQVK